jgi:hypothetical protein
MSVARDSANRRRFLLLLPAGALALACDSDKPTCKEPAKGSLPEDQEKLRGAVGYKNKSPAPDQACSGCQYFNAGDDCGTCEVMPGPTSPGGTCNLFRAKS